MRNLEVSLWLRFHDQGSGPAKRAATEISQAAKQASQSSIAAAKQEADAHVGLWKRVTESRKTLGIRTEKDIQAEIHKTQDAYQTLASASTMSAREQARALAAMKSQVRDLNRELKGTNATWEKMHGGGRVAVGIGTGAMAAGYVLKPAITRTLSYDRRLAEMANTAYADRDIPGRRAGMADLDTAIKASVRTGGGSREQAATTLDHLISSGALGDGKAGVDNAIKLLPTLQKYSTATGADPTALANIAIRAKQSFNIGIDQMPLALDMAIKAGQEGGFELKDMARWLPQQMAAGRLTGMKGLGGFGKLLAVNQSAVIAAGTKDEAGNNLVNLLAKINSIDTANDAKKLGINLPGTLAAARSKGIDGLDAFVGIVDKVVAKNPEYQKLQQRLAGAKGTDHAETLSGMSDILQGSAIGKIVQDRQALMALVGYMNNRDYVKGIERGLPGAAGTGQSNFDLISETAAYKVDRLKNEKEIAEQNLFTPLNSAIGDVSIKLADYAGKYPGLTTAVVGATAGATALAAAAISASGALMLIRGGMPGLPTGSVPPLPTPISGSTSAWGAIGRVLGVATAVSAAANFTTKEEDEELLHGDEIRQRLQEKYPQQVMDAARKKYQPWYQLGEGSGVESEKWIQQYLQDSGQGQNKPITVQVHLDGKQIAEYSQAQWNREARRQ